MTQTTITVEVLRSFRISAKDESTKDCADKGVAKVGQKLTLPFAFASMMISAGKAVRVYNTDPAPKDEPEEKSGGKKGKG